MLQIHVPEVEIWDQKQLCFINLPSVDLTMEHSLISVSKWESKWHKPFLSEEVKTNEEARDYFRCMVMYPKDVDPLTFTFLTRENEKKINEYIKDSMTATWFSDRDKQKIKQKGMMPRRETITSELVYYWMVQYGIPFECEKWHLNRLLTLIRVCGVKNAPVKQRSQNDILRDNAALNAQRKKALKTKG